jgi:predicted ATPase
MSAGGITLFDRGVPDCAVYAMRASVDPGPSLEAAMRYRYESTVLLFEPWREIYATDTERRLTFDDAVAFGDDVRDVYRRCGYQLVPVPHRSISERIRSILDLLTH